MSNTTTAPAPLLVNLAGVVIGEERVFGFRHAMVKIVGTGIGWYLVQLSDSSGRPERVVYVTNTLGMTAWRVEKVRNGDLVHLGDFGMAEYALGEALAELAG